MCAKIPEECVTRFTGIEHRLTSIEAKQDQLLDLKRTFGDRAWGLVKAIAVVLFGVWIGKNS